MPTFIDIVPFLINIVPTNNLFLIFKDPAELGVQPKGPGITYADPQTTRVKTSKDPVSPPPR